MLSFHDLKEIRDILTNSYYVPHPAKVDLAELLEDVMELKDKKSPEEAIAILKSKMKNELKSEVSSEMQYKVGKLEQLERENKDLRIKLEHLEKENKDLQTKKDEAKRLNIYSENENTGLRKELENKNKTLATIGASLAVGLVVYIALEHITGLSMVAIISIAAASALVVGSATYALKSSTQVDGTQEPQGVANESLLV